MAGAGVDDEAGRLVDDKQVLVAVDDPRRRLRRRGPRLYGVLPCFGRDELQRLPALEPIALRSPFPVDEHARGDDALGGSARADAPGEEAIEPLPGGLRWDDDRCRGRFTHLTQTRSRPARVAWVASPSEGGGCFPTLGRGFARAESRRKRLPGWSRWPAIHSMLAGVPPPSRSADAGFVAAHAAGPVGGASARRDVERPPPRPLRPAVGDDESDQQDRDADDDEAVGKVE